jgi:hypothetical protein
LERMKMNPMLGCSSEDDEPPLHIYEEWTCWNRKVNFRNYFRVLRTIRTSLNRMLLIPTHKIKKSNTTINNDSLQFSDARNDILKIWKFHKFFVHHFLKFHGERRI